MARRTDPRDEEAAQAAQEEAGRVEFPAVTSVAQLKRVAITPRTNGATYTVTFEIDVEEATPLAQLASQGATGMQVDWQPESSDIWHTLSTSARLAPSRISPDPDGGWRFDLQLLFPQSDIIQSIAVVAGAMAANALLGQVRLSATQGDMDLTSKAE